MAASSIPGCVACTVHGPHCFCNLPAPALMDIESIGTTMSVGARETIKREGYSADRVFIICKGHIKLTASSSDGKLLLLRIAGPGDILGLASLLRGSLYRISAETLEPCELKSIPRPAFLTFMRSFTEVASNAAEAVSRHYDEALLSARRLALSNSAAGKLANTLLDWAHSTHAESEGILQFSMPLTHEELGCMAGLSRETVTRLLNRFRAEGLIIQHAERMTLLQPQKLESLYC